MLNKKNIKKEICMKMKYREKYREKILYILRYNYFWLLRVYIHIFLSIKISIITRILFFIVTMRHCYTACRHLWKRRPVVTRSGAEWFHRRRTSSNRKTRIFKDNTWNWSCAKDFPRRIIASNSCVLLTRIICLFLFRPVQIYKLHAYSIFQGFLSINAISICIFQVYCSYIVSIYTVHIHCACIQVILEF